MDLEITNWFKLHSPCSYYSVQSDATVDSGFGSQPMEEEEPPVANQWQAGNTIPSEELQSSHRASNQDSAELDSSFQNIQSLCWTSEFQ